MSRRLIIMQQMAPSYTAPSYTPTANTLSYWKLNGNATDVTGNNNGTATNVTYVNGMYPGTLCAKFTGSTSKINCGAASNFALGTTGSLTIIAWYKTPNKYRTYECTLSKRNSGSGPDCFIYNYTQIYADGGGTPGAIGTIVSNADIWHMAAYVYDRAGGRLRLYVDGVADTNVAFGATTLTDASATLYLGAYGNGTSYMYEGYMQEVIAENKVWTAEELLAHYNTFKPYTPIPIITSGLVAYWDAANISSYPGTGTNWYDLISVTGNTMVLTNGTTWSSLSGGSMVLDGTNDTLECSNQVSLNFGVNDWSISIWFYVSAWNQIGVKNNYQCPVNFNQDGMIFYGVNKIPDLVLLTDDTSPWRYTTPLISGKWYNAVATRTSTTYKLYLNGLEVGTTYWNANWVTTGYRMGLGYNDGNGSGYLNGRISQCGAYNRVINQAEVTSNYNSLKSRYGY